MKGLWFPSLFSTWTAHPVQVTRAGWGAVAGDILGMTLWHSRPALQSSPRDTGDVVPTLTCLSPLFVLGFCFFPLFVLGFWVFFPCLCLGLGFFPSCLCLGFGLFSPCLCLGFVFCHCLFLGFVFFPLCAWVLVFDHRFCRAASPLPLVFPLWCHQASSSIPWQTRG